MKNKLLVACEESQAVTIAFRNYGINAFSCDIANCSGGHPEWHIKNDVGNVLNDDWLAIIAFPPCTDLAISGARYFAQKIMDGRQQNAIQFFMMFANAKCKHIAIENPIGIMSKKYRKPDQIIQPWYFGHPESKTTCLWLKNLPLLKYTDILQKPECGYWQNQTPSGQNKLSPGPGRAKIRSKTYNGIALAMAQQWGNYLLNIYKEEHWNI